MNDPAQRPGEVAVYGGLAVIGATVAVTSVGYGVLVSGNRIGPGFLPLVCGVLLAVLGAVLAVRVVRRPAERSAPDDGPDVDTMGRTRRQRVRILWAVFALVTATVVLVLVLGFIVSFGLMVLVVSAFVERRRLTTSLLVAIAASALVYLVFVLFMKIPLPWGAFALLGA